MSIEAAIGLVGVVGAVLVPIAITIAIGWSNAASRLAKLCQWTVEHDKAAVERSEAIKGLWQRSNNHEQRLTHVEATCDERHAGRANHKE